VGGIDAMSPISRKRPASNSTDIDVASLIKSAHWSSPGFTRPPPLLTPPSVSRRVGGGIPGHAPASGVVSRTELSPFVLEPCFSRSNWPDDNVPSSQLIEYR
jgi:hypothetical protein